MNWRCNQRSKLCLRVAFRSCSPTLDGNLKRGMDFWSPIGDSPIGNWLQEGHRLVTKNSLVMLILLLLFTLWFRPESYKSGGMSCVSDHLGGWGFTQSNCNIVPHPSSSGDAFLKKRHLTKCLRCDTHLIREVRVRKSVGSIRSYSIFWWVCPCAKGSPRIYWPEILDFVNSC